MNTKYEILDWDSNFFGFNVCKINEANLSNNELTQLLTILNTTDVKLAYYAQEKELKNLDVLSDFYYFKLVDKKTTYVKNINNNLPYNNSITEYKENYPEKKLLELAIGSGVYSRFYVDNNITKEKCQELYSLWIINSVNKKLAKEVLVYKENKEIVGFVSLGEKNFRADIGIIAVDSLSKGKGIGKSLMQSAEKWFEDNKYTSIQVVTQGENVPACRLYESCGYNIEKVEYFYHVWKK